LRFHWTHWTEFRKPRERIDFRNMHLLDGHWTVTGPKLDGPLPRFCGAASSLPEPPYLPATSRIRHRRDPDHPRPPYPGRRRSGRCLPSDRPHASGRLDPDGALLWFPGAPSSLIRRSEPSRAGPESSGPGSADRPEPGPPRDVPPKGHYRARPIYTPSGPPRPPRAISWGRTKRVPAYNQYTNSCLRAHVGSF